MRAKFSRFVRLSFLASALAVASPAIAQDTETEADEAFDSALTQFGYAAGASWQCSEGTEQDEILRQSEYIFHRLSQLFGTDSAFFFAASFGAGTVDEIEPERCDAYKRGFEDALASRNLGGE